jgi:GntR family transcriptional regulator, histidine utilization repressor
MSLGWPEVRAEALRRIRAGHWAPGARIPDEADLAVELGCARATVNRALRELAAEGALERRRKGGTRVPVTPVRRATLGIPIIRQDVEGRGHVHGYRLLSDTIEALPPEVAADLELPVATPLRHVLALHLADGSPWCLEDRWLDPGHAAGVSFAVVSANEWLVRNLAVAQGRLVWSALALQAGAAALLGHPPGAPALALDRVTATETGPITRVRLTYAPGHRIEAAL